MNRKRLFLNEEQCQNCKYDIPYTCAMPGKCEDCHMSVAINGIDNCLCLQRATDEEERKNKCKYFVKRREKNDKRTTD